MKKALLFLALACLLPASAARSQEPSAAPPSGPAPAPQAAPAPSAPRRSLAQVKRDMQEALPRWQEENRLRMKRMKIVRRPENVLRSYDPDPALWKAINDFYTFIKNRELDVYEEQEGLPAFFPDRASYYEFLDTIIPPMRDRRFERDRLLDYRVHAITPVADEEGQPARVRVVMSIDSDDTFPFGKTMVYTQTWIQGPAGWSPGKIEAEPATWWERIR